ncbi:uncharacterized protein [Linepithema humile]|uniref:uncharacterized protein n=1 Tax=Linepithema humile TaxID=83485 RepID=UPI00351EED55
MHPVTLETQGTFPAYYMPHHAVFKDTSSTTKIRVVFDASCKTDTGVSLNDILMVGPTLQQDLISILFKFRIWQYVLTGDVAKMYRQVLINESQWALQRILWRNSDEEEVRVFELTTVTYGTASASFLAVRSLQEIAKLEQSNMPMGSARILSDFYVDDLLTGADSIQDLITIRNEVNTILSKAGFVLRKWASNEQAILNGIPTSSSNHILNISEDVNVPTLGMQWNSQSDTFQFNITTTKQLKISKRSILSTTAHIFDPLGILGPIIITAKIFMQRLWQLKVDWDEAVPSDIQTQWSRYESELHVLNKLQIPRKVIPNNTKIIELCGFSDASEKAYGACVYIRSKTEDCYETNLLCAKSRVAPLKNLSLPRLELCAALLLAQLVHKILKSINVKFTRIYHWSDSTIALSWIKSSPRRWSTFVANRVSAIQDISDPNDWYHMESSRNPADIVSRGMSPALLLKADLWWKGPTWHSQDATEWHIKDLPLDQEVPEQRKTTTAAITKQESPWLFDKYSTFNKLVRVYGYILRFINNCHFSKLKRKGRLSSEELNMAIQSLVKMIQSSAFLGELKCLCNHQQLPRNSKLASLSPFLDEQGILRVGGRLQHANIPYSARHQMVLPSNHSFTRLLIQHEHSRLLHAGSQTTLASLRQGFWPLNGRNAVRHIIRRCIKCFRTAPSTVQPIMGNLPKQRVQRSRAFSNVGIDFCGPFQLRESKRRNVKTIKSYAAIFVCLVTKAVHIEITFDLSAEGFIHVLKRFIGRRGNPTHIFSDNATNFVGADRELKEFYIMFTKEKHKIVYDSISQRIQWHFIPPRAPNFGGIWEAAVRSFKTHFKRVVGTALLITDEMQTLSIQIEAILNSRPITVLSNDLNDLSYLSPGHFLIGDILTGIPEPALIEVQENRLSRWQRVEQMRQHLWRRWSKDYLNQLQQRTKWSTKDINIAPGDMVLIREDNVPPLCWPLGRVQEVHPGDDGVVRAATIKTAKGIFKRPSNKLSLLPMEK